MDFDDTPEEAAFRAEARTWLEAHAPKKGSPEDFSTGYLEATMTPEEFSRRVKNWLALLVDHGWAAITWPKKYGGRGGTAIQSTIWTQEAGQYGATVAKHHLVDMKDYAGVHGHRIRPERMGCNPERYRDCGPDGAQQKEGPKAITEERVPPIVALWFDRRGHGAPPGQVLSALRVVAFQTRIASLLADQRPLPAFGTTRRAKCL